MRMAIEVCFSILIEKLKDLMADSERERIDPKLMGEMSRYMEKWGKLPILLKVTGDEDGEKAMMDLLLNVYFVDDIIDNLLLKSSLKAYHPSRMSFFLKPFHLLRIPSGNLCKKMEKLVTNSAAFSSLLPPPPENNNEESLLQPAPPAPENNNEDSLLQPPSPNNNEDDTLTITESKFQVREPSGGQYTAVIDLDDQRDELVKLVVSSRSSPFLISVIGEGGSGKTTFVKSMYNSDQVRKHFNYCAWIYVSTTFNSQDLLKGILTQVTVVKDAERLTLESLKKRVSDFFLWKKFLVVLDDIQSPEVWTDIKEAFPNSARAGSRIILTAPKIEVARSIDPRIFLFQIRRMDHTESWKLFLKKVRMAETNFTSLKENILSKCDGLPIAIVALAGLLSTKSQNQWSTLIADAGLSSSSNILALNFTNLSSPLKACLIYMSLFPKSMEVNRRRLFGLWLAEGIATSVAGESSRASKGVGEGHKEDLVKSYFAQLVNSNLIEVVKKRLDGSPKTCYLSPTLREILFDIAGKMEFFHVHPNLNDKTPQFSVRRIAEYKDINTYLLSDHHPCIQDLRSYISFNSHKGDISAGGVDKLLKKIIAKRGFGLLTVLDLENVHRPFLSETLGKLLQLKYLGLRRTFLDSVPKCIGKLPCLETLDVKHTNITTLPISIWKVKKLRHLYLSEIHFDAFMHNPRKAGSLPNLQTLSGLLIGNNTSVIELLKGLTGLRKLGLTCYNASLEKIIEWLPSLKDLESLKLRSINELHEPSDLKLITLKDNVKLQQLYLLGKLPRDFAMHQLPQHLRDLTLSVSKLHEDPMPHLGKLRSLHILRFFAQSYQGKHINCSKGFPELRVLKLWNLEELEEWTLMDGSMPKIRKVEIRCCRNLKQKDGLMLLASLKKLTLTGMPEEFVAEVKAKLSQSIKIKTKN